ncbi:AmmeMemoRadiSam system protein B [Thermoproteota archaeon]
MAHTSDTNPQKKTFTSLLSAMGWYPDDPQTLSNMLESYINKAEIEPLINICALILPHAGYVYSGQTTAYGINQIKNKKFKRIIILGPSHSSYLSNSASIPNHTHYKTPLGELPLDIDFIAQLQKSPYFITRNEVNEKEHSVQIQLPFLQKALPPSFKLVPIVVGQIDETTSKKMAQLILNLIDNDTLIIISSDFTHYGYRFSYIPFKDHIDINLEKLDMEAYTSIATLDSMKFRTFCQKTGATICGSNPISILLNMLPEQANPHLLRYDTSGKITNDWSNSVSYLTIAFTGKWKSNPEIKEKDNQTESLSESDSKPAALSEPENKISILSDSDKTQLLKLARGTITYYLKNDRPASPQELSVTITPAMQQIMGAFVTLKKAGRLRGCIGEIMPRRPLYNAVMDQAVNSALNDPRFPPVQENEVKNLEIEISALTAPKSISTYLDIELGKHGIILEKSGRSAVFLPQVAPEQGWNLEETLTHLSQKAGLSGNAWKENTKFRIFEAIVFSE